MRFDSVRAHPFGPFEDATLAPAPRMTVIYGPNEAGKSSWHAALYAGLCGLRRGKGAVRSEDRDFEDRHRPWDAAGGGWTVTAVVALADGRRIELRQDLASRNCSATDADLAGADYANEIVHDGSPDGSRFLGLNRNTFLGVACVRQADVLGVLDDPEALQEDLQRAAATAGADSTAARALELLEECFRERVGSPRATTKPLPVARRRLDEAREALDAARRQHDDYAERHARLERHVQEAALCEQRVSALRALIADVAAEDAERRAERAADLQSRFPGGAPRPTMEDDRLLNQVADALAGWRALPGATPPAGKTVEELEREAAEVAGRTRTEAASTSAAREPGASATAFLALGVVGMVLGIVLLLAELPLPGIATLAGGAGLVWWGLVKRRAALAVPDTAAMNTVIEGRLRLIRNQQEQRLAADRRYAAAMERHSRAAEALGAAALAAGVAAPDPEGQADGLVEWRRRRQERVAEQDRLGAQWDELQQVLAGREVGDLRGHAERLRDEANGLSATVDADVMAEVRRESPGADQLGRFEEDARAARAASDGFRGEMRQREADLPSVVGAEEDLEAAERDLAHLQQLGKTLKTTVDFLERAEERVHRDIAPVLKKTVLEWLPRVTGGRYDDCKVDPESLQVDVRGGGSRWRDASYLSRGTAEQVYLLLRLALARHLTAPGESCPMILDDVVAACDAGRKVAVLETLRAISRETQVVLFTHEDDVLTWAKEHLAEPEDRVVMLPPPLSKPAGEQPV
ncbi:MAG: AAA family ATPase [Acidobacteria bacterium]|nr:AAA family ATPase [Acidobacteriota bacterium]MYJ03918.1 AAA family ATPase [Acidobacteriota bacterium]